MVMLDAWAKSLLNTPQAYHSGCGFAGPGKEPAHVQAWALTIDLRPRGRLDLRLKLGASAGQEWMPTLRPDGQQPKKWHQSSLEHLCAVTTRFGIDDANILGMLRRTVIMESMYRVYSGS